MLTPISIQEAAKEIRDGKLSPLELLERCLAQIRRHEQAVHAWVLVDEAGARRTATERTREAERGCWRGPLHGIPIGVKDIIDVKGLPTRAGSPLLGHEPAVSDAPVVAALRRAGAVIVGKTVTVEFACFDPSPTRNPWNFSHTPGGSSSGSAAALATGMCLGALGTQTGGSLVRPSAYCGVATCKPTFGRLSRRGIVPVSASLDHPGPMARTVGDVAVLLHCLLGQRHWRPLRSAFAPSLGWLQTAVLMDCDAAVARTTQAAMERLVQAGAEVHSVGLPRRFAETMQMHRRIMAVEAAAVHRQRFAAHRDQYGPMIAALLEEGLTISAVDYVEAKAWHRAFRREASRLLDGFDALVMPSTPTTAPPTLATTGTPHFQAPWSLARLPVVSFPCGLADDGLPVSLQLIGRTNDEARLLEIAAWCEAAVGFTALPPLWESASAAQSTE